MQDKQKVTLYLPPDLHRRLKIKAAVETDSMSAMVEKAVFFYLQYPEVIEEIEEQNEALSTHRGQTHRVYSCPECHSPLVHQNGDLNGELASLRNQPSILIESNHPEDYSPSLSSSEELSDQNSLESNLEDNSEKTSDQSDSGTQDSGTEGTLVTC